MKRSYKEKIDYHYSVSNEFYQHFLDKETMSYTCNYFASKKDSLEQAAINKLQLIANKLDISKNDHVLDLGCGWGNFTFFIAKNYGCKVSCVTLSDAQYEYIVDRTQKENLTDLISPYLNDATKIDFPSASFDKIAIIGLIEHVEDRIGLFKNCHQFLKPNGLFMVHTITKPFKVYQDGDTSGGELIGKYVFPAGLTFPVSTYITELEQSYFEILDVETMTDHYALTLEHWLHNLEANRDKILQKQLVPEKIFNIYRLYLAGCAKGYQGNRIFCYQILNRKHRINTLRPERPLTRKKLMLNQGGTK